jgi:hypothetical protein
MPAFSLARFQDDLAGGRLTGDNVAEYLAAFSHFNMGQLRHLSGRLGLPDPLDRGAALAALADKMKVCMSGVFPVAAGSSQEDPNKANAPITPDGKDASDDKDEATQGNSDVIAETKDAQQKKADSAPVGDPVKIQQPKAAAPPAGPGGPPGGGKGGKASYESPGSGGGEKEALWDNEGGASPGKGGKASYESPGSGGGESEALWDNEGGASPGKGGKASEVAADADIAEPVKDCPGCPGKIAGMGIDIGGDGDDDSNPLTPEHVMAEAGVNGVTDPNAAQILAAEVNKDNSIDHTKIHSLYDMVNTLTAGGGMTQGDAAKKAASLASVESLRTAAAAGDPMAARVVQQMPSQFASDYWGEVVLSGGRPRTRLAVFAEFLEAGVPESYTALYLADAPKFDIGGEWLTLEGQKGQVRVRVGFDGTITGGAIGLVGRPATAALVARHHAAAFAAQSRAKASLGAVVFEQGREPDGKFGGGGGSDTHVSSGKLEAESKKVGDDHMKAAAGEKKVAPTGDGHVSGKGSGKTIADLLGGPSSDEINKNYMKDNSGKANKPDAEPKKSGGFGGMIRKLVGGKAGFGSPATTGIYAKVLSRTSKAAATFAAALKDATPAGLHPEYYWDELVHGQNGPTTRMGVLAQFLDANHSVASAAEESARAEFVIGKVIGAAKAVGTAVAKGAGHVDRALGKLGGGGGHDAHGGGEHGGGEHGGGHGSGDDGHWLTISGAAGTTHICIDEEGKITKGPEGMTGRPAKEALADHHHEMIAGAMQKAKEKREAREKGEGSGGATHAALAAHGHSAGHKLVQASEHLETAVHFLMHPGAEAASLAASKVLGSRVGAIKAKIHKIEGKIRERYGSKVGTAILLAGVGTSFAGATALHGIGHIIASATPGMGLVGALPYVAVAESVLQGGRAIKMGGKALGAGLDRMKKASGSMVKFLNMGGAKAEATEDGPKSKKQAKLAEHDAARKNKDKAEKQGQQDHKALQNAVGMAAQSELLWSAWPGAEVVFGKADDEPNGTALDMPASEIEALGKKYWAKLMAWYNKDLTKHAGDLKVLNDAIEAGRTAGLKGDKDAKKHKGLGDHIAEGDSDSKGEDDDSTDDKPATSDKPAKDQKGADDKPAKPKADEDKDADKSDDKGDDADKAGDDKDDDKKGGGKPPWMRANFDDVADGHAKATELARKLSRHARTGKVASDRIKAGMSQLAKFPNEHIQTAARCLGLGGPMGGKADSKKAALKRIAAHLRTHARAAAAELHRSAGLPVESKPTLVAFDGLPRTRPWVERAFVRAGVPADKANQFAAAAVAFCVS